MPDEGCLSTLVSSSLGTAHQNTVIALFDMMVEARESHGLASEPFQMLHRTMRKAIDGTWVKEDIREASKSKNISTALATELLGRACQYGLTELAVLLLDCGANPEGGSTLLNQMLLHSSTNRDPDAMNAVAVVAEHLLKAGADLNAPDELEQSPIQVAVQTGAYEVVTATQTGLFTGIASACVYRAVGIIMSHIHTLHLICV